MGEVHFANPLGHWLAPLLLTLRSVGFFEWYVYMPAMTLVSFPLYRFMARRLDTVPAFRASSAWHQRVRRSACYAACFLLPNVLAVALKTLIVEEMDYVAPVWYAPLVSPLHFYIASVTGAYLWMIGRTRRTWADWACAGHIQLGLVGGYAVAGYRLLNEPGQIQVDERQARQATVMERILREDTGHPGHGKGALHHALAPHERHQRLDGLLQALPEGRGIDAGSWQHVPIDKICEDLRHLQPARPDVVDHGRVMSLLLIEVAASSPRRDGKRLRPQGFVRRSWSEVNPRQPLSGIVRR